MKYRQLGRTGLRVSEISLGSWLTYGNAVESDMAAKIIHHAYELGINFFDTANVYAGGEAEKVVGQALRSCRRDSYVLATKAFFPMGDGPNDRGLSRKHIFEQVHASLKRLNVDYVDIFYCHRYDPETPVEETLRTIDDLIRQGKILYAGVSTWTAAQLQEALCVADKYLLDRIVVNQPLYNMLERSIEREVIPLSEKNGIGQVVFSPLAQGLLTGKYNDPQNLPSGSRATNDKMNRFITGYITQKNFDKIAKIRAIADKSDVSMPQLALAWILRQPNVVSALIGASRPEQVTENIKALDVVLSKDMLEEIEGALSG